MCHQTKDKNKVKMTFIILYLHCSYPILLYDIHDTSLSHCYMQLLQKCFCYNTFSYFFANRHISVPCFCVYVSVSNTNCCLNTLGPHNT